MEGQGVLDLGLPAHVGAKFRFRVWGLGFRVNPKPPLAFPPGVGFWANWTEGLLGQLAHNMNPRNPKTPKSYTPCLANRRSPKRSINPT